MLKIEPEFFLLVDVVVENLGLTIYFGPSLEKSEGSWIQHFVVYVMNVLQICFYKSVNTYLFFQLLVTKSFVNFFEVL